MPELVGETGAPASDRLTVLQAFDRALRRESHVLRGRPEILWQQLYNRLQWEEGPFADHLASEWKRRSRPGARPWFHRYTHLRESEALVRTLTGHTKSVDACAVSPDGTWIVSASYDHTLKIWDTASGAERATLAGHTDRVNGCAVSPDGTWIVSASWDGTIRIWDAATSPEWAVLVLPGAATAVAFHPSVPMAACGDTGGGVHLARLIGMGLGPLVATAAAHSQGRFRGNDLTARCPACREPFPVDPTQLGAEITCPNPACNRALRLNQFTLH
jgi:hypothetical protein